MHELTICQSVLRQVIAVSKSYQSRHVKIISLHIGPLAGVEPALLSSAFPLVAAGTICEGATINIQISAVRVECQICGAESGARANRLLCAACGTWRVSLVSGDEMRIDSVELGDMVSMEKSEFADV